MMQSAETDARPQGTFWLLDLAQPLPIGTVLQIPVAFMRVGPEAARELAQAMDLDDEAAVLQRFDDGRHCYVGRIEGKLVTYGWVTFDEEHIGELSLSIRLKTGEAYIWNCATLPAYRGQRLYPALLTYIVGELHRQGMHRIWIGTDTDNLPSQSGIILAGFRPVADVVISNVLTMRRAWVQGRPGISERLVMDIHQAVLGERGEVWQPANAGALSAGTTNAHLGQPLVLAGEPPGSAQAAMVMLHGRGATAQDILTLTTDLHCPGFIYLAPQAAGNTWYPNSFLEPFASNEPDLSWAMAVISSLLGQLAQVGIPAECTIILGFSQGACLALEYIARNARPYGGVAGLSGGLIGPDGTPRDYPGSLASTPIFLGCGDMDPHIPKERVEQAAEALQLLGGNVTTRFYPHMDHTVNQDELRFVQDMMASVLSIGN